MGKYWRWDRHLNRIGCDYHFHFETLTITPSMDLDIVRLLYKDQSDVIFAKINEKMERIGNIVMPLIIFSIAGLLVVDSILYFTTGNSLLNFAYFAPSLRLCVKYLIF